MNPRAKKARENRRRHAKIRARQRTGINLTKNLRKAIIKGIQNSRYKRLYGHEGTWRSRTFLIHDTKPPFKVVYSREQHDIITVIELNLADKQILKELLKTLKIHKLSSPLPHTNDINLSNGYMFDIQPN